MKRLTIRWPAARSRLRATGAVAFVAGLSLTHAAASPGPGPLVLGQAQRLGVWDLSSPSLAIHQLLACGTPCASAAAGQMSLLDRLLLLSLSPNAFDVLHRGQLLATLAAYDVALERTIVLTDLQVLTVAELLTEHRRRVAEDVELRQPWNASERRRGPEYGWVLKAFCHYLGPTGEIAPGLSVPQLIDALLDRGISRGLEGGSHELGGLTSCLNAYHSAMQADEHFGTYRRLASYLTAEARATLATASPSGQGFPADGAGWVECEPADSLCALLVDLSKQAHLLEWLAALPETYVRRDTQRAVERLEELAHEVVEAVTPQWIRSDWRHRYQYAGAAAHTVSVLRALEGRSATLTSPPSQKGDPR